MQVSYFGSSRRGRVKPTNQDRFAAYKKQGAVVLAVCDGLGGHTGGDVAADMAVDAVRLFDLPLSQEEDSLLRMAVNVSEAIKRRGQEDADLEFMGTTMTTAVISDSGCWFVHVGDSRLYRFRQGALEQLSTDHRFVQEFIDAGEMTENEALQHPLRNQLDQALGVPDVEPQTGAFDARPGDVFLVCSDGISEELSSAAIGAILSRSGRVEKLVQALVQSALEAGGHDNATAVVARVE